MWDSQPQLLPPQQGGGAHCGQESQGQGKERDEDADWRERMLWRWSGEDDDDDQFIQVCLLSTGQSGRTAHHPESVR